MSERFEARSMAGWIAVVAIPSILASIVVPPQDASAQNPAAQNPAAPNPAVRPFGDPATSAAAITTPEITSVPAQRTGTPIRLAQPQNQNQSQALAQKPLAAPIRSAAPIEFAMIQEDEIRSASDEPSTLPLPRRLPSPQKPPGPKTPLGTKTPPGLRTPPGPGNSDDLGPRPLSDLGTRPADGKRAADAQKPAKAGDKDDRKKDDEKGDDEDESRRERIDEKPLREVSLDIRPTKGTVPPNAAAQYYRTSDVNRHPQSRGWGDEIYLMETPRFAHNPLYFEQPLRERGGIEKHPRLGPVIAGARFLFDTLKLPYQATVDPHESLVRTPPRHHVGNPQAWRQQPTGTQLKGLAVQAAAVALMIWIIP